MADEYIRWSDVRIEEEVIEIGGTQDYFLPQSVWTAEFEGNVHARAGDTGIVEAIVSFSRSGSTANEAVVNLIEAATAQGWDIL